METANALSKKFGTKVQVGRVDLGLMNRIIIDDVYFYDQSGKLMLKAARLSAKFDLIPLSHGKISISSAQLFAFNANLYKQKENAKPNYQFMLDSLASKDTTQHHPLDLRINSLIVRHGNVRYDQYDMPETNMKLNMHHLHFSEFNANVVLKAVKKDSINVNLKRLAFRESSGLVVHDMGMKLEANNHRCLVSGLNILLDKSHLNADTISATYKTSNGKIIPATFFFEGRINPSSFNLSELGCLIPTLRERHLTINLATSFSGTSTRLRIKTLQLYSNDECIKLVANGSISNWEGNQPVYYASISRLFLSEVGIRTVYGLAGKSEGYPKMLQNIGMLAFNGEIGGIGKNIFAHGLFNTSVGNALLKVSMQNGTRFNVDLTTDRIDIGRLTDNPHFGTIKTNISVKGNLQAKKLNKLIAKGIVYRFEYNDYAYNHINIDGSFDTGKILGSLSMDDPNGKIDIKGSVELRNAVHKFDVLASVRHFNPDALKITNKWHNAFFDADINTHFTANDLNDAIGTIDINDFVMTSAAINYKLQALHISAEKNRGIHRVTMQSDFGEAEVTGHYDNRGIAQSFISFVGRELPTLPGLPKMNGHGSNNDFTLKARITKTDWLNKFLNIPLQLNSEMTLDGFVDDRNRRLSVVASIPNFDYNDAHYENAFVNISNPNDTLCCKMGVKKYMDNNQHYDIDIDANAINNRLSTVLSWTNQRHQRFGGKIAAETQFYRNELGKPAARISVLPSHIIIKDTTWNVKPAHIDYYENNLKVSDVTIEHNQQHVIINGVASKNKKDSIIVDLHDADVEYILGVVNFHAVDFSGLATGKVHVTSAFSTPSATGKITVNKFKFEDGRMGVLHANAQWNNADKQIDIQAIADDSPVGMAYINGYVSPSRNYIDLSITPQNTNIEFMNSFLGGIMDHIQGRATGNLRLYGPLSNINLTGMLNANGEAYVKCLNTTYQLRNDSIKFIPDEIEFLHSPIYDKYNNVAYIDGRVHHKHLTNLSYDLNVSTNKLLCYDFHDFGDNNFYGTVFADGNVGIHGKSGQVTIDVDATPLQNSIFVYNAANPNAITNQQFITWNDKSADLQQAIKSKQDSTETSQTSEEEDNDYVRTNIYLNFLVKCNQDATLKVMMDNNTGDYISLNGDGVIRATYYNKGGFNMFGTYTVEHGIYKLTVQNIIRKDFIFKQGGTIVFGGDPYEAALNLQAVYTVNSASLSDLNVGNSFANNNVKVNCIMNLSGQPKQPTVNFDLDLPNVNADEKQMVRSIINSEEDMNQQVLYLLGIGRFYTQGANNANNATQENQTTLAMQSFISGTLSSQLNSMLSSLINNNKWNFGANISTGNEGWYNAEYEGLLSGRLLNNRLLINGQFGYRDKATSTTTFVGDFDIQYLLMPNGNMAIKGYNQTNDRYFTKSSLNTQGIGLVMKKDFNGLWDLFGKKKK